MFRYQTSFLGPGRWDDSELLILRMFSWSRDGHKLVSASTDNIVSQWDVLTGDCDQRFRFPSPILKLQCHPRDM